LNGIGVRRQIRYHLQSGVHRLAFQRQYPKYAFMDAAERLAGDESFQGLNTERELADG
jgi:hypothetical protein